MRIPVILMGDSSAEITLRIGGEIGDAALHLAYQGVTRVFPSATAEMVLAFTAAETARFKLGTYPVSMRLVGADGSVRTIVTDDIRIKVTDCPGEVYPGELEISSGALPLPELTATDSLGDVKALVNRMAKRVPALAAMLVAAVTFAVEPAYTTPNEMPGNAPLMTNTVDWVSNTVPSIVTNEVDFGFTEWRWSCDDPVLQAAVDDGRVSFGVEYNPEISGWNMRSSSHIDGYIFVGGYYPGGPDETVITFNYGVIIDTALTPGEMIYIAVTVTRERIIRNSLGLATLKDLEGKADASITNEIEEIKTESALIYRLYSGSNIIMEVTNYNSRVNPPEMRLMRLNNETGAYDVMWTETNGLERTYQRAVSNATAQVAAAAAELAPRAWSKVTSGLGSEAPANTTWISTPQLVVAGGLEFQKVITSRGDLWFLSGNGMMSSIGANEGGFFEISAADGTPVFSIEKTDSYLVGVDADSITRSGDTVTVTLSVVSEDHPLMRYSQTLDSPITWQKEEDGFTSPIEVAWSGSSGAWVATVTTTASSGYFTFEFLQEGGVKLKSSGSMDVSTGGILCTDGVHKCRPVYNNGTITWEAF